LTVGGRTGTPAGREADASSPQPKSILRDYAETILVCVIFVVFSRAFAFQQSKIPSGSMMDTLLVGDYILVNRFLYAPTTFEWEKQLLPVRDVRRGDIVVFKYPRTPEIDYIKRIVGLPGDVVEVRQGYLYVNGARQDDPYVKDEYRLGVEPFAPREVPPGHYFAMGDHRNSSADSRAWGFVPRELLKGRALFVWWSYDESAAQANPQGIVESVKSIIGKALHLASRTRWSRCFRAIR